MIDSVVLLEQRRRDIPLSLTCAGIACHSTKFVNARGLPFRRLRILSLQCLDQISLLGADPEFTGSVANQQRRNVAREV